MLHVECFFNLRISPSLRPSNRAIWVIMKRILLSLFLCVAAALDARADLLLARDGKARCVIVRQPGATPPEASAVAELADTLRAITGAEFPIVEASNKPPANAIIVGPGP